MKCLHIFRKIINMDNERKRFNYVHMADKIIPRLKLDNNTKYKVYCKANNYCKVAFKNKDIRCELYLNCSDYSFTYKRSGDIESCGIMNVDQEELLNFLNQHGLLNNIRTAIIEGLEESKIENLPLIEHTCKIFDVLIDDVFTERDSYFINTVSYPCGIVLCYLKGYMLSINDKGFYGLYIGHRGLNMVWEQKGNEMEFDDFHEILRIRKLAYPDECEYKDASLYILNIE